MLTIVVLGRNNKLLVRPPLIHNKDEVNLKQINNISIFFCAGNTNNHVQINNFDKLDDSQLIRLSKDFILVNS